MELKLFRTIERNLKVKRKRKRRRIPTEAAPKWWAVGWVLVSGVTWQNRVSGPAASHAPPTDQLGKGWPAVTGAVP